VEAHIKYGAPDFFKHGRTVQDRVVLDENDNPIPWVTYPCICYLKQIDFSASSVFEYGVGSSTQFWAARANQVVSVEHDEEWAGRIRALQLPRVELLIGVGDAYVAACARGAPHNVIVIDGRWRYDCAIAALGALSPNGMVILDNSERYPAITQHFREHGLLQVDFIGLSPMCRWLSSTSIFFSRAVELRPAKDIQPHHLAGMIDSIQQNPQQEAVNKPGSF